MLFDLFVFFWIDLGFLNSIIQWYDLDFGRLGHLIYFIFLI